MYSGQQKSPTSSREPPPGPPPLDNPNPWPRTSVSALVLPLAVWAPRLGVRPRASSGACVTLGAGEFLVFTFTSRRGSTISGAFAAGGRTGCGLVASSGDV